MKLITKYSLPHPHDMVTILRS